MPMSVSECDESGLRCENSDRAMASRRLIERRDDAGDDHALDLRESSRTIAKQLRIRIAPLVRGLFANGAEAPVAISFGSRKLRW